MLSRKNLEILAPSEVGNWSPLPVLDNAPSIKMSYNKCIHLLAGVRPSHLNPRLPRGEHSNASKSFNFSQLLRTMRWATGRIWWEAWLPALPLLKSPCLPMKTKTKGEKTSATAAGAKNCRESDKSIWIDKCHQNRSGIKFIMESAGAGGARWDGIWESYDIVPRGMNPPSWDGASERLHRKHHEEHEPAAASSINSSVRQFLASRKEDELLNIE